MKILVGDMHYAEAEVWVVGIDIPLLPGLEFMISFALVIDVSRLTIVLRNENW